MGFDIGVCLGSNPGPPGYAACPVELGAAPQGKPSHDDVRAWVGGFWKAMALVPAEWSALITDERTQVIVAPFTGFIDVGPDIVIDVPDDIDERLDEAAPTIPRAILLLRNIAAIRPARKPDPQLEIRSRVGRNEPCPCGSGKKFKRCCSTS
jgi:uncharacterized protein